MFKKKILIIDDTELMVKLITDVLSDKGYMVVSAHNGVDGIKMVAAEKPDLVLLDIVMPGLDGFEVCKLLREDESNNLMPIIILTAQGNEDDKLTGLPGNIEIQSEISQRIAKNLKFAVLYLDVDNFKSYNDVYGFASGDRAIKMIADILADMVHTFGSPGDFIGHIGGDDFVIVTITEYADILCEIIIKEFGDKIPQLYSKEDKEAGFIYTTNRRGYMTKYPIMTLSIAVVTNEHRELLNHIHVSEIAAELKKKAKSIEGSVYLKDRRTQ